MKEGCFNIENVDSCSEMLLQKHTKARERRALQMHATAQSSPRNHYSMKFSKVGISGYMCGKELLHVTI